MYQVETAVTHIGHIKQVILHHTGHQGASHAFQFFPEERFLIQLSIHNPYPCFQLHHGGSFSFPVKIDHQVLNRKP